MEADCKIISIISESKSVDKIKKDQEAIIIIKSNTFYGESGGQIGDTGQINFKKRCSQYC